MDIGVSSFAPFACECQYALALSWLLMPEAPQPVEVSPSTLDPGVTANALVTERIRVAPDGAVGIGNPLASLVTLVVDAKSYVLCDSRFPFRS